MILSTISEVAIEGGRSVVLFTQQAGQQTFISPQFTFRAPSSATDQMMTLNLGLLVGREIVNRISFKNSSTQNIDVYKDRFNFMNAPITVSSIGNSLSYLCQLPNKSGTIALTDDCFSSVSVYSAFRNAISTEKFPLSNVENGRLKFYIIKETRPGSSTLSVKMGINLYNGESLVQTVNISSFSYTGTQLSCMLKGDIAVI